jgi:GAF domain-containing protein
MQSRDPLEFSSSLASLVVTDQALDETLLRVAVQATRDVPGCDLAGITLLRDGRPVTAVFTDPNAPEIDTAQYDTGKGPCLDAFRHSQEFRIDDTRLETRWPEFAAAAASFGVLSTLSLPLVVGTASLGALNLYSYSVSAFLDDDGGGIFAAQAAVVLANAQAYWASRALAGQLEEALASRAVIEQAKGILMATQRCDPDAAFALLRSESQNTNRKVRDVAADHVRRVSAPVAAD